MKLFSNYASPIPTLFTCTVLQGLPTFEYNADGRVSEVTEIADGLTHTVSYEYHATGQTEKITFNSGMVVEYVINPDGNVSEVKVNEATLIGNLKNLPFGPTESMSMEDDKLSYIRNHTLRYQPEQILAKWAIPTPDPTPTPTPGPNPSQPPFPTPTPTEPPLPTPGPEPTVTESMSLAESTAISATTTTEIRPFPTSGEYVPTPNVFSELPQADAPGWVLHGPMSVANPGHKNRPTFGPAPQTVEPEVIEAQSQPVVSLNSESEPVATLLKTGGNETVLLKVDYTYYANGNVETVNAPAIPSMSGQASIYTLVPDKGNRLDNITTGGQTITYSYDNNGNITSDDTRTFVYNQHNRLIRVENDGMVIAEYSYNAFGQRIKKVASGKTVYYHYDLQGNLMAENNGDGTPLRDYIYLNGERITMMIYGDQAGIYYFLNDHLGTPHKIVNSEGVIVWEAAYLPFGKAQIITETVENNFRFPGQYFDSETGLHYNWHRYYDPKTGRFLAPDPIGLVGGMNLFTYAGNDPINYIDPLGLDRIGFEGVVSDGLNQISESFKNALNDFLEWRRQNAEEHLKWRCEQIAKTGFDPDEIMAMIPISGALKVIRFGRLKVPSEIFHRMIKPNVLKDVGKLKNYKKFVGNNPDVRIVGDKIILTGRGPFKGNTLKTNLLAKDYLTW